MSARVCLVIPAYNEDRRLTQVIHNIKRLNLKLPIIVVDDGSAKPVRLSDPSVFLLRHQLNLGKGAAMKTGAEFAFNQLKNTTVIFMDADGQHNPNRLPVFLKLINQGYDLILGSRRPTLDAPLVRLLGNKFASIYINIFFGVYVSDILSGFRALSRKAYSKIKWSSSRYGVETEMLARLGKHQKTLKFVETEIDTIYIDKYKGVTIIDALQILINSIWWKLS